MATDIVMTDIIIGRPIIVNRKDNSGFNYRCYPAFNHMMTVQYLPLCI